MMTGHKTTHSSYLRAVQVCGEHNDGVGQHVGSVCAGKQSLSAEEEASEQQLEKQVVYWRASHVFHR